MTDNAVYHSDRLAHAYAFHRPPVHERVIRMLVGPLRENGWPDAGGRPRSALDVGCGAGLSTAALAPLAEFRVGLEPAAAMLAHARQVDRDAHFLVSRAEQLPFADYSFDLVAAAGSLNYVDLDRALSETSRVLTENGLLLIYDFSSGRRLPGDERLERWFEAFETRYPFAPGYAMDVNAMPFFHAGLRLRTLSEFEVTVPMTLDAYVDYVLSETNVETAIRAGTPESGIAEWCRSTLTTFFPSPHGDVCFKGYFAICGRVG